MGLPSILYLEDENQVRWELAEALEKQKYPVVPVASGVEAVAVAQQNGVGLLLADIKMDGELDGIEAASKIQQMHPDVEVIFVTAFAEDPNYVARVRECALRVYEWVVKPLTPDVVAHLLTAVEALMDMCLMREMLDVWTKRGWTKADAWGAMLAVSPMLGLAHEALDKVERDISILESPDQVSRDLSHAVSRLRECFHELEDRQLAFDQVRDIALERLSPAFRRAEPSRRRQALLIGMAVRKMKGLELTMDHLSALEYATDRLHLPQVELAVRRDCRRVFRRAGIETMMNTGPDAAAIIQEYENNDEMVE